MGTSERRTEIMKVLCRRRHETIANLANEFRVSERTIIRDIEVLSVSEPIYTQRGKYGGGVYVVDSFYMTRMYMTERETDLLEKIVNMVSIQKNCSLSNEEQTLLKTIVSQYKKPNYGKEV